MLTTVLLSDVLLYHPAFPLPSLPNPSIHPSCITIWSSKCFSWAVGPGVYLVTRPQLVLRKMFIVKRLIIDEAYLWQSTLANKMFLPWHEGLGSVPWCRMGYTMHPWMGVPSDPIQLPTLIAGKRVLAVLFLSKLAQRAFLRDSRTYWADYIYGDLGSLVFNHHCLNSLLPTCFLIFAKSLVRGTSHIFPRVVVRVMSVQSAGGWLLKMKCLVL